ncbi:unnamed protein product [Calypogeia fissa]
MQGGTSTASAHHRGGEVRSNTGRMGGGRKEQHSIKLHEKSSKWVAKGPIVEWPLGGVSLPGTVSGASLEDGRESDAMQLGGNGGVCQGVKRVVKLAGEGDKGRLARSITS